MWMFPFKDKAKISIIQSYNNCSAAVKEIFLTIRGWKQKNIQNILLPHQNITNKHIKQESLLSLGKKITNKIEKFNLSAKLLYLSEFLCSWLSKAKPKAKQTISC